MSDLTIPAERILDVTVAEQVMGFEVSNTWEECMSCTPGAAWNGDHYEAPCLWAATPGEEPDIPLLPYSSEIGCAMEVLTQLVVKHRFTVSVGQNPTGDGFWCEVARDSWRGSVYEGQETLPLAICRAALEALKADKER